MTIAAELRGRRAGNLERLQRHLAGGYIPETNPISLGTVATRSPSGLKVAAINPSVPGFFNQPVTGSPGPCIPDARFQAAECEQPLTTRTKLSRWTQL